MSSEVPAPAENVPPVTTEAAGSATTTEAPASGATPSEPAATAEPTPAPTEEETETPKAEARLRKASEELQAAASDAADAGVNVMTILSDLFMAGTLTPPPQLPEK